MKNIEVEVKYLLPNHRQVKNFLDKHAQQQKVDEVQEDSYYTPAHENFLDETPSINKWLRIRKTHEGASINFKHWHDNGNSAKASCDEIETSIGDSSQLALIFERLAIRELVTVTKTRSTYRYRDVEISLDHIENLGWFIEIESVGDFTTIDDASAHIFSVADELDVRNNQQDKRGYPYLLMEQQGLL